VGVARSRPRGLPPQDEQNATDPLFFRAFAPAAVEARARAMPQDPGPHAATTATGDPEPLPTSVPPPMVLASPAVCNAAGFQEPLRAQNATSLGIERTDVVEVGCHDPPVWPLAAQGERGRCGLILTREYAKAGGPAARHCCRAAARAAQECRL
jgi:hypothetical protein